MNESILRCIQNNLTNVAKDDKKHGLHEEKSQKGQMEQGKELVWSELAMKIEDEMHAMCE